MEIQGEEEQLMCFIMVAMVARRKRCPTWRFPEVEMQKYIDDFFLFCFIFHILWRLMEASTTVTNTTTATSNAEVV